MESKELGGGLSGGVFHDPPELIASAVMIGVRPRETSQSGSGNDRVENQSRRYLGRSGSAKGTRTIVAKPSRRQLL